MSPRYRAGAGKRVDATSKDLIAYAKQIGFDYEPANASFDGVLSLGPIAVVIDWKAPGASLTPSQQRMVTRGFPVRFISTPAQLDRLQVELLK